MWTRIKELVCFSQSGKLRVSFIKVTEPWSKFTCKQYRDKSLVAIKAKRLIIISLTVCGKDPFPGSGD